MFLLYLSLLIPASSTSSVQSVAWKKAKKVLHGCFASKVTEWPMYPGNMESVEFTGNYNV